ncbi:MAG: ROK family glucokinase [Lachnospiraceae bacterium]|nr:ROK family glucokinase [Lachnospiraceae bacterium]
MGKVCFGADVGGTSVKLGLFDETGALLDKWEIPSRKEKGQTPVLDDVAASVLSKITEKGLNKDDVIGIGIDVPGPVLSDGTVIEAVNLYWDTVKAKNVMEELTGLKTEIANDANAAALGEMWLGGGKGYNSICMITLGTGVGGGIILDGQIVAGSNGAGGEIGHMLVNYDETEKCNCGKCGCLEQYCSATGIVRVAKRYMAANDTATKLRFIENLTAKDVLDAAKENDAVGVYVLNELGRYLAIACSHVAHVIDVQAFVVGGGVSKAGEVILDAIKKYYPGFCMKAVKNKEFKLATLGNDAGIYGCAKMVLGK